MFFAVSLSCGFFKYSSAMLKWMLSQSRVFLVNSTLNPAICNEQKELKHTINLHPSYFGPQTDVYVRNKLHSDVEGTCSGRLGYIIAVLGVSSLEISAA